MKDPGLSNKAIRGLHAMLRQCLEQAVAERLLPANPADYCKLPAKEKKEMQVIPLEEIRAYLAAAALLRWHKPAAPVFLKLKSQFLI